MTSLVAALALPLAVATPANADAGERKRVKKVNTTYDNPLAPVIPGGGSVDNCADPTVIKGQAGEQVDGEQAWYMYCTTDPLNDEDLDAEGGLNFRPIPTMVSTDLVNWTYVNDALANIDIPAWVDTVVEEEGDPVAAFWAPEVVYSTTFGQYYLFVTVTQTNTTPGCDGESAIGVATSTSPTGPWDLSDTPVVAPRQNPAGGCNYLWTFDPDVLGDSIADTGILYYGSYYGGVFGTTLTLTEEGAVADQADATMVAIDNKYEGANVVHRDGWYYLFLSATNCCNGALTGYSVFVGRSRTPLGTFVDQQGNSLVDPFAGGTPFLTMNGNRWVGTGHNTVFQDAAGDWWTIYHAVDQEDPFFETSVGFTKRPALLDPIDWVRGWPTVNGGAGPSDGVMPAPAGQPGQVSRHRTRLVERQEPGRLLRAFSDEFNGTALSRAWTWDSGTNAPAALPAHSLSGGALHVAVQVADTFVDADNAHVLVRDAPRGDFVVETRVRLNVPVGCCPNFAQAGIGVYEDEDNLLKLTHTSIWNTRQTEWAKEIGADVAAEGWSRYGNTVVGPPSPEWTYLRIAAEELNARERAAALGDPYGYTAYTSQDGKNWVRGGTWTHTLGNAQQIALFAMGLQQAAATTYTADFDYVRTYTLREGGRRR